MMRYLEGSYQQNGESVMCIFVVVSFLIIVCFQFIIPNTLHSLANFYDVILSASNLMTWYVHIPNAYAETINDSQRLNIIGNIDDGTYNTATPSNNNNAYRNTDSNQNWSINFINLVVDSAFSVYRMFAALGLSFVAAILIGITAARKPLASKIIVPIIDILQSVPILGFFPAAIAFFITLFNGSPIGRCGI